MNASWLVCAMAGYGRTVRADRRKLGGSRTAFAPLNRMLTELGQTQIDRILHSECFGRLGCHSGNRTYVVPMTYVYDGSSIISHTGTGMKVRMMRENPNVCFEVDRVNQDGGWLSVIVQGRFEELHGDAARTALQALLDHLDAVEQWHGLGPPTHGGGRFVPSSEQRVVRPEVIFRINVAEKSGRTDTPTARVSA